MAKGRILQKRISNSRKMVELSSDTVRLLYTWMLAHLDVNGCFYGDPVMINNLVFTRLQKPIKVIEAALDELEAVGLIVRYLAGGEAYLAYPDFSEKQPSLQASKEGKPVIPPPTLEQLRSNSRVTPEILCSNIIEEKRREVSKCSRVTPQSDDDWVKSLKGNAAYKGMDVETCYRKMLVWCETNGKKPTRRRFVNWLNREERPLQAKGGNGQDKGIRDPQGNAFEKCPSCKREVARYMIEDGHCYHCADRGEASLQVKEFLRSMEK